MWKEFGDKVMPTRLNITDVRGVNTIDQTISLSATIMVAWRDPEVVAALCYARESKEQAVSNYAKTMKINQPFGVF